MNSGRKDFFGKLVHGSQHTVFRIAAVVLSSWSALQVYAIFSGGEASPVVAHVMDIGATVSIVAIGYFVLRGLAHRIKEGKSIGSYVLLTFLYALFEVMCNLGSFSGTSGGLVGLHLFLVSLAPFAKSMMPVFAGALAWVDVDLMREQGSLPVGQPKFAGPSVAQVPSMPSLPHKAPLPQQQNGLQQFWNAQRAAVQQKQAAGQHGQLAAQVMPSMGQARP
jgi:hypothetical protein